MGKLFNLKEWLTVPDTAKHLSIVFGEEVTVADVLRLALDGHLKLSVNFVNKARAKCGKVVPIEDAQFRELPPELVANMRGIPEEAKGKPVMMLQGINIDDKRVLELGDAVISLDGVWDLLMLGAERLDIEHEYQNLTGGPAITLTNLEGAFVEGVDGEICQLQESFDDNEYQSGSRAKLAQINFRIAQENIDKDEAEILLNKHKEERKKYLTSRDAKPKQHDYYPAGNLPDDVVLVVRTKELRLFEQKISDKDAEDKPLKTTERNTLLTIIAALCDYSDIDPNTRGVAKQIANLTQEIGASVNDDTVRSVLQKIPDALETRKK